MYETTALIKINANIAMFFSEQPGMKMFLYVEIQCKDCDNNLLTSKNLKMA